MSTKAQSIIKESFQNYLKELDEIKVDIIKSSISDDENLTRQENEKNRKSK